MQNPLTTLRKLGVSLVRGSGVLDGLAAARYGIGPLKELELVDQARKSAIDETRSIQGLQSGNLDIASKELGLKQGELNLQQDSELFPLTKHATELSNTAAQQKVDETSRQEELQKATIPILAKKFNIPESEVEATLNALKQAFSTGTVIDSPEAVKATGMPQGIYDPDVVRLKAEKDRDARAQAVQAAIQARFEHSQKKTKIREDLQVHDRVKKEILDITKNVGYTADTAALNKYKDIESAYQHAVSQAAKGGSLNADTQIIINDFNKILDPASVVRESEYARSQMGNAWVARVQGIAQTIMHGGTLPLGVLKEYVDSVKIISSNARQRTNKAINHARAKIATVPGVDPDAIDAYIEANFDTTLGNSDGPALHPLAEAAIKDR